MTRGVPTLYTNLVHQRSGPLLQRMLSPVGGDKDDVQPRSEGGDGGRECRRPGGRDPRAAAVAWDEESRLLEEAKQAASAR